jgi:hypothetical protein
MVGSGSTHGDEKAVHNYNRSFGKSRLRFENNLGVTLKETGIGRRMI